MKKFKFLLLSSIFCFLCKEAVALLCHKNPTCFCTGKKSKSIYCRDVMNVSDIQGLLRNQVSAYRLRITGNFTTLPSRAFNGFSVNVLGIVSPLTENIPEDSLLGVRDLQIVNFNKTRYKHIPEAFSNKNFKIFQSTLGLLSEIDTQLQNMTNLIEVLLNNNAISVVSTEAFYGSNNIEKLDLAYNELNYLETKTFAPLKFLKSISLKENQLYTVDGYFQTLNPVIINLYGNNLQNIDNAFHRSMWSMRNLNLGGNLHLQVTGSAFNGSMKSLVELHLSDIGFSSLDPYLLKYFPTLSKLYLNRNNLTSIPDNFFRYSSFLSTLELSDNHLESIDGLFDRSERPRYSWKKMLLDGNELTSVKFGENFRALYELDLSRNQIKSMKKEDIELLGKLNNFNLSWNGLLEIESQCFSSLHYLRNLDISGSNLKSLNSSIQNMDRLNHLIASNSSLESLSQDEFTGSDFLTRIILRNNSLSTVHGAFRSLKYINWLDVSMNNLTTLTMDSFPPFQRSSIRIQRLWMADNPWSCDCRLAWIVSWLSKTGTALKDDPTCFSPVHLKGKHLSALNKTDFERWVDDCPEKCECLCRVFDDSVRTEVNCSQEGLTKFPEVLPSNVLLIDLSGNVVESFDGHDILHLEELVTLNLENNKIEKIHVALPNKTTFVGLAGNEMRIFPLDEWNNISSSVDVTLSHNPWTCNCDTWFFRNWLIEHNRSVPDAQDVRCGPNESVFLRNKIIITLSRQDLCQMFPIYIIVIISVSAGFVLVLCLMCYCQRQSLFAWLYSCGCTCLKSDDDRDDAGYDAYLLYAEDDEQLALGELAKGLEDEKHSFLICIPNRDIPSQRTAERLSAYMLQCNRVIVLLTRKLLENYDCMYLLKSMVFYSLESSARHIIFITHGEIPSTSELDSMLAAMMKHGKCLRWNERFFWQKLVYYMPKKKLKKNTGDSEDESLIQSC